MSNERRKYSSKLKSQIALEAVIGLKSTTELSKEYKVHPNQIAIWKKHLLENLPIIFENPRGPKIESNTELTDQLYRQIGKLQVEVDWLKKKYGSFN
jgi:putative transposase